MPWMRCDAMVKGWLTTAMEKNIRDNVKYANTTAQMWSDLRERFGEESSPRAYELKQKIVVTQQDDTSIVPFPCNTPFFIHYRMKLHPSCLFPDALVTIVHARSERE